MPRFLGDPKDIATFRKRAIRRTVVFSVFLLFGLFVVLLGRPPRYDSPDYLRVLIPYAASESLTYQSGNSALGSMPAVGSTIQSEGAVVHKLTLRGITLDRVVAMLNKATAGQPGWANLKRDRSSDGIEQVVLERARKSRSLPLGMMILAVDFTGVHGDIDVYQVRPLSKFQNWQMRLFGYFSRLGAADPLPPTEI